MAPTPNFTVVYGDVLVNGQPAPTGTRVEIITPRGELAGYFELSQPGVLGYTHVYGAEGETGGFLEGDILTFRVNGLPVEPAQTLTWTNDYDLHEIQLIVNIRAFYLPLIHK